MERIDFRFTNDHVFLVAMFWVLIGFLISIWQRSRLLKLKDSKLKAEGTITEIVRSSPSQNGTTTFDAKYKFNIRGRGMTQQGRYRVCQEEEVKEGDSVVILYDSSNIKNNIPETALKIAIHNRNIVYYGYIFLVFFMPILYYSTLK